VWKQVALVYKDDARSADLAGQAADILRARGLEIWVEGSGLGLRKEPPPDFKPDLVISLGGDGTLLYAARAWGLTGIPLFGVNLGSLGFLAETDPDQFTALLKNILKGEYRSEKRMALEVSVERQGQMVADTLALNEVVVNKGALSRIITLNLQVKDFGRWSFRADGVIISTPHRLHRLQPFGRGAGGLSHPLGHDHHPHLPLHPDQPPADSALHLSGGNAHRRP